MPPLLMARLKLAMISVHTCIASVFMPSMNGSASSLVDVASVVQVACLYIQDLYGNGFAEVGGSTCGADNTFIPSF